MKIDNLCHLEQRNLYACHNTQMLWWFGQNWPLWNDSAPPIQGIAVTNTATCRLLAMFPSKVWKIYLPSTGCPRCGGWQMINIPEYAKFIWAWPDILSDEPPVLRRTFWILAGPITVKSPATDTVLEILSTDKMSGEIKPFRRTFSRHVRRVQRI